MRDERIDNRSDGDFNGLACQRANVGYVSLRGLSGARTRARQAPRRRFA
jgi:hypothetical protein